MVGADLKARRQQDHLVPPGGQGHDIGQLRPAFGQGAGLVEGDGLQVAQGFQDGTALDQQALARTGRQAGRNGRRGRDHQGAGAGDQQKSQRPVNPGAPILPGQQGRGQGDEQRDGHHRRHIDPGETVDEAGNRGLGLLRFFHQADDAGDGIVFRALGDFELQRRFEVDGAGEDLVARALAARHGFAVHRGFVQAGLPLPDHAIGRHPVARTDQQEIADLHLIGRDFPGGAPLDPQGEARGEIGQGLDAAAGPGGGIAFQHFADGKEEDDHRRLLARIDRQGADGGNGHEHFDSEDRARCRRRKGPPRHRRKRQQGRDAEGPGAGRRCQPFDDKGEPKQQAGGKDQPCLGRLPPGLAPVGRIVVAMVMVAVMIVVMVMIMIAGMVMIAAPALDHGKAQPADRGGHLGQGRRGCAFGHRDSAIGHADIHLADAGQAFQGGFDLDRAAGAIHAVHFQAVQGGGLVHGACPYHLVESTMGPEATRASRKKLR